MPAKLQQKISSMGFSCHCSDVILAIVVAGNPWFPEAGLSWGCTCKTGLQRDGGGPRPPGTAGLGAGSDCTPLSCCLCWVACVRSGGKDDTSVPDLASVPAVVRNEPEKVAGLRTSSCISGSRRLWRWRPSLLTLGQDREAHYFQARPIQSLCISLLCGSGKIKNEAMLLGTFRIGYFQIRNVDGGEELIILCLIYKHFDCSSLGKRNWNKNLFLLGLY